MRKAWDEIGGDRDKSDDQHGDHCPTAPARRVRTLVAAAADPMAPTTNSVTAESDSASCKSDGA